MGWTLGPRAKGVSHKEYFQKEFSSVNILEASSRGTTVYLAAQATNKDTGEEMVFAVVCLTRWNRKDPSFNFGYKDIDETMGPVERDCPEKVLRLLTPPINEHAKRWREECWEKIRKRKGLENYKVGDTLLFEKPIRFLDGFTTDTLICLDKRKKLFQAPPGFQLYKLDKYTFDNTEYVVV